MTDIEKELKNLNDNATLLLTKYDGVFSKLGEESQKILLSMKTQGQAVLDDISEMLASGKVAQAENALKLGGKTLEEVLSTGGTGNIRQIKQIINNSQYSTSSGNYVKAFDFSFDNEIDVNSTVLIQVQGSMYRDPYDNWASYITVFRDGTVNCGKQKNTNVHGNTEYSAFRLGSQHQNSFSFTIFDKPNETNPKYSIMFADHAGDSNTTRLGFMGNNDYVHGMQIIMMEIGV